MIWKKAIAYNPFVYLENDNDIQKLVTNLFKSTTPKGSQTNDPFWDTAAQMLLLALIFYLHYEAPEEEQNFAMVMYMLVQVLLKMTRTARALHHLTVCSTILKPRNPNT